MAEIKNGILSEIRGSVGNITGRIYKGRNILSRRPGFRKPSDDPASVARRNNFKLCVKFGSAACSIGEVKTAWGINKPADLSYFNYFIKVNIKMVSEGKLTGNNLITPYGGFPVSTSSSSVTPASLSIGMNALTGAYNFDLSNEVNVKLFAVIYLSNPANPLASEYFFMPVEFELQAMQLTDPLQFTKDFLLADQTIIESYNDRKVYAALATLDADGNLVNFSSTLSIE